MAGTRRQSVDVLRGVALLAMAAYHAIWDLAYFRLSDAGIGIDPVWITIQRSILTGFLLLAGGGLVLAHGSRFDAKRFWKREALLVAAAAAVSLVTWFQFGPALAWFGVLHLIAVGSVLALPFIRAPLLVTTAVAAVVLGLPALYSSDVFDAPWLSWIGFFRITPETADLVPIFPWFGVMLLGVIGMRLLKDTPVFSWELPWEPVRMLAALGRASLLVYLVHQPLLIAVVTPLAGAIHSAEEQKLTNFLDSCTASCMAGPGKNEGAGASQFCTAYCRCALDMTVRDNLWDVLNARLRSPEDQRRVDQVQGLCTAMSE